MASFRKSGKLLGSNRATRAWAQYCRMKDFQLLSCFSLVVATGCSVKNGLNDQNSGYTNSAILYTIVFDVLFW
jgi:hypothetical protein